MVRLMSRRNGRKDEVRITLTKIAKMYRCVGEEITQFAGYKSQ